MFVLINDHGRAADRIALVANKLGISPRRRVDLILVGRCRKASQFVDERIIPVPLHQKDATRFDLGSKWFCARLFISSLRRHSEAIASEQFSDAPLLRLAGLPRILW